MMYRFLLIFSLIGCFFLSACDDISHETKEYHEDDTYSDELEAAMELLDANMGNSKALTYADVVISLANDENATEQLYYGITQKMTIYMGMAEYGKLESFVDSVYEHTGLANDEYYYGYSVFLRSLSNIEQGKFKIAIRYAQELYDASKDESYIARAVEDSLDINLPQYIRNRCTLFLQKQGYFFIYCRTLYSFLYIFLFLLFCIYWFRNADKYCTNGKLCIYGSA